jgi:hypothetical protein
VHLRLIVCIDSICYLGTDDLYLNYLPRFVKPGGEVGIAGAGRNRKSRVPLPIIYATGGPMTPGACTRQLGGGDIWERTGIMDINVADTMPDGWQVWLDWQRAVAARESQQWFRSVWHSGDLVLHLGITGRDGSLTF